MNVCRVRSTNIAEPGHGPLELAAQAISGLEHSNAQIELALELLDYGHCSPELTCYGDRTVRRAIASGSNDLPPDCRAHVYQGEGRVDTPTHLHQKPGRNPV